MNDEPWHLSKSVPITFILAITCQTVALIWFVATLRNDVDNNANEIVRTQIQVEALDRVARDQSLLLARIDENLKAIKEAIERREQQ